MQLGRPGHRNHRNCHWIRKTQRQCQKDKMYSRNITMNESREVLLAMQTEVKVVEYSEEGVRGKGLDGGPVMILHRDAHRKARQIRNVFFIFIIIFFFLKGVRGEWQHTGRW